jgi:methionyl-tRNA synthetase
MNFAQLLTADIKGVEPKSLAATVKEASAVKATLGEAYDAWIAAVQAELKRQAEEQVMALSDAGLIAKPTTDTPRKRGRKSKAEKEAEEALKGGDAQHAAFAHGDLAASTPSAFDAE